MVTKGYIKSLPEPGDNHFLVRVPILEDNTGDEVIMQALLCAQPGDFGGYRVGDCVFVSFEGDKHMDESAVGEVPVIIGKLYLNELETSPSNIMVEALTVTEKVNLPNDVKIGNYNANDIFKIIQNLGYVTDKTDEFNESLTSLIPQLSEAIDKIRLLNERLDSIEETYQVFMTAFNELCIKSDVSLVVPENIEGE